MMPVKKIICLLLIGLGFSCTNKAPETIIWSEGTQMVSCDTLSTYSRSFVGNILLKDNSLVIINSQSAEAIHVLDIQTSQRTSYVFKDTLNRIDPALFPISFYHYKTSVYYQYTMENDRLNLSTQKLSFRKETVTSGVHLNKNKYVTLGFFDRLLGLYDKKSKEMQYFGRYPLSVGIPFDRVARKRIVQDFYGEIVFSEKHSKVVYGSGRFAYLSCYRFTGGKLVFQWEKHIIPPPQFRIINGYLEYDMKDTQSRLSAIATVGDYIFANLSQSNARDSIFAITNNLMVYHINGDHIATYPVDYPLSAMAVDLGEKTIYGISSDYNPVIVRFRFE
jgi:hypothetical protein